MNEEINKKTLNNGGEVITEQFDVRDSRKTLIGYIIRSTASAYTTVSVHQIFVPVNVMPKPLR